MEHERAVQNLAVECYLLGEMSPGEREAFEEHYFECALCAEDVRAATQFIDDAKEILAGQRIAAPIPIRGGEAPAKSSFSWAALFRPQAAAFVIVALVAALGVETFSTIPGLRREVDQVEAPREVKSIVLRPVTRGDATAVKETPGESAILVFDPPDNPTLAPGSPLKFVVKAMDGHVVSELSGEEPASGEQITLSEPRFELPPGNYTLIVEAAGTSSKAGQELGKYPFKLEVK